MTSHPRILLITRNLPPLVGGMERLNWHMADELAKQAEVRVLGPKGAAAFKPQSVTLTEAPLKPLPLFLLMTFFKGLWITWHWRPDVILAGSGLTAPIAWLLSKLCGARSAAYLHGFDITVNHNSYRRLWRPTFRKLDQIIVNSTPTQELAMAAGIRQSNIRIIHPGVNLPDSPQPKENITAFKEQHGLIGKKILLSVGRLTTRKGLREFVEKSLPYIVRAEPDVVLVVVGEPPKNSLGADIQTVESIQDQAEQSGLLKHISFLGVITDKNLLATIYEAADVHVFPVRCLPNDPEGFGMVAIEAAAHGIPTAAFATGGIIDAVREGESGYLAETNNYNELSQHVLRLLQHPIAIESIQGFAQNFTWEDFGIKLYTNTVQNKGEDNTKQERKAHVVTNLASRIPKAQKIEQLLDLQNIKLNRPIQLLEIGCGSGGISHYFATSPHLECQVTAIDIHDNRQITDNYEFIQTQDVDLPFEDQRFDVVITNHVIEHVGDTQAQISHLKEIQRVLRPEGLGYLAVPNRWMLTEPHYRLKFLSWWPRSWRSGYLKIMGKGNYYDCEPLEMRELESLLRSAELHYQNLSLEGWRTTLNIEHPHRLYTRILAVIPDDVLRPLRPIIPTLIYRIERPKQTMPPPRTKQSSDRANTSHSHSSERLTRRRCSADSPPLTSSSMLTSANITGEDYTERPRLAHQLPCFFRKPRLTSIGRKDA